MTNGRLLLALLALALLAAQATPARRAHHALGYDEANARVLLTGGSSPMDGGQCCTFFNDLWSFDGAKWTQLSSSGAPMSGMRLAYDGAAKQMLSFGGYSNGRSMSDLRALENGRWTALAAPAMAAAEGGFVYDARRQRFVAFGGSAGRGQANGETWGYASGAWTKIAGSGPAARQAHAMVYDERRGRVIVYGGTGAGTPPTPPPTLADLWELDGDRWTKVEYANGPSPRHSAGVAWDSRRNRMIVFGGMDSTGFLGDTWSYGDGKWTKLADASPSGPSPRAMGYLAYDKQRDRVVMFGGRKGWPDDLADTWEWDGAAWRRFAR